MTAASVENAPLLSFCIPTYNRSHSLIPLVHRLLTYSGSRIELVVADNGSTDGTLEQLADIDDCRLRVIKNATNHGAVFNQVNVLLQGRGEYCALLLDKDSVNPELIDIFLEFLRKESPFTGYCEYYGAEGTTGEIFSQGEDGLRNVAYSCHHPSGYFFRVDHLRELNIVERFTDLRVVGNFPFEFMQAELCLRGPAAIFHGPLFVPESLEAAKAIKSFTINATKEDAFFTPKGRLRIAINFSTHILGLPLSLELKRKLVADRFLQGLSQATLGYRSVMANEAICAHYHVAVRRIGGKELLGLAGWFCRSFLREMTASPLGLQAPGGLALLTETARRILQRVGQKLRRRFG